MYLRTIKDLRDHLKEREISPEDLGRQTRISNMTIRRMLERADTDLIAPKYHPALDQYVISLAESSQESEWIVPDAIQDFAGILEDLEKQGAEPCEVPSLKKQLQEKLASTPAFQSIREHTTTLLRSLNKRRAADKVRALTIGALLYFLNPADLIPDVMPSVGYFDDFAILSLVVRVVREKDHEAKTTQQEPKAIV